VWFIGQHMGQENVRVVTREQPMPSSASASSTTSPCGQALQVVAAADSCTPDNVRTPPPTASASSKLAVLDPRRTLIEIKALNHTAIIDASTATSIRTVSSTDLDLLVLPSVSFVASSRS